MVTARFMSGLLGAAAGAAPVAILVRWAIVSQRPAATPLA
jgi:hypothetical protein